MTTNQVTAPVGPVRTIALVDTSQIAAEFPVAAAFVTVNFEIDDSANVSPADTQYANVGDRVCFKLASEVWGCSIIARDDKGINKNVSLFGYTVVTASAAGHSYTISSGAAPGDYTISASLSPVTPLTSKCEDKICTVQTGTLHVGS